MGSQYSYVGSRSAEKAAGQEARKACEGHFNQDGYWQQSSVDGSEKAAVCSPTELGIKLESQLPDVQVGFGHEAALRAVNIVLPLICVHPDCNLLDLDISRVCWHVLWMQ